MMSAVSETVSEAEIVAALPLVRAIARRYQRIGDPVLTHDDLVSEGTLGLLEAARHYQPERASFATYAAIVARGRIIDAIRRGRGRHQRPPRLVSLAKPVLQTGVTDEIITLEDTLADAAPLPEELALHRDLWRAVAWLPARERLVLRLTYQQRCSQGAIAARLGISESRVTQVRQRAERRLRQRLEMEA